MIAAEKALQHDLIDEFHDTIERAIYLTDRQELLADFAQSIIDILDDEHRAQLNLARRPPITPAEAKAMKTWSPQ